MFYNCEDVIQVDTPQEEPRLIVEALIRVNYDSPMDPLQIKVSVTSPFFGVVPATELEQVTMVNIEEGGTFVAKVLAGGAEGDLQKLLKQRFSKVANVKPPASRSDSSEKFVVATGFKGASEHDQ